MQPVKSHGTSCICDFGPKETSSFFITMHVITRLLLDEICRPLENYHLNFQLHFACCLNMDLISFSQTSGEFKSVSSITLALQMKRLTMRASQTGDAFKVESDIYLKNNCQ